MVASKLFVFCIYFALLIVRVAPETANQQPEDSISSLRFELEQLKSKVPLLESSNGKNILELKSKDESITRMEKIILEQAESIAFLQNKIDCLQRKGLTDTEGLKNGAETIGLEKQDFQGWLPDWLVIHLNHFQSFMVACWKDWWKPTLDKLFQQIQVKIYQLLTDAKMCIETFESDIKGRLPDWLVIHLNHLQSFIVACWNDWWKPTLDKLFQQDFQGWLPDWLVIHLNHFQSFIVACWKDWWKPTLDKLFQQIQVTIYQLLTDAKMCIETFETEWIAVQNDQWLTFMYNLKPHVEFVTSKTIDAYHVSKNSIMLHTVKIQKATAPFIQEALKFAEPYLNQIETVTNPYLYKACVMLESYSRKPVEVYRKVVTSATLYHMQVQEMLKSNEVTKSLATMDLAWLVATAALCLPVVFLSKLHAAIVRKKERNSKRVSHIRRRIKRSHPG